MSPTSYQLLHPAMLEAQNYLFPEQNKKNKAEHNEPQYANWADNLGQAIYALDHNLGH